MTTRTAGLWLAALVLATTAEARAGQSVIISGDFPVREAREMPKGGGLILGRVIEGESGSPVPGATVFLSLTNQPGPNPVLTTDDGHFVFRDLPAGSFTLRTSKPGWVAGAFGKRRPDEAASLDSRSIDLAESERLGDVTIRMWKFAAVEGQVVDESGEPMVNVPVRAMRRAIVGGRLRYEVTPGLSPGNTDDRGMFRIATLVPGEYIVVVPAITATRAASAVGGSQSSNPSYSESSSGAGRWVGGASIVGSRLDAGDADYSIMTGASLSAIPGYAGRTKDGRILVYETQFHPSSNRIGRATLITLGSGEERTGINFQLRPVPTSRVAGTIVAPDGAPGELMVRLVSQDLQPLSMEAEIAQAVSSADGRFTFLGVPPGDYRLRIDRVPRAPSTINFDDMTTVQTAGGSSGIVVAGGSRGLLPETPTLFADQVVSVGSQDVVDVTVPLRQGARVRGRVEFSGNAPRPPLDRDATVYVDPADGTTPANFSLQTGRIDAAGNFNTYGQAPGRYFIRMPYPFPGWRFVGAMHQGRDLSVVPLELGDADVNDVVLTFTDAPANELTGYVRNDRGAEPDASVVVFPTDPARWTDAGIRPRNLRLTGVDGSGRYRVTALPPGSYYVAATADVRTAWADPRVLQTLAKTAARVQIAEGEKKTQDLTIARRAPAPDPSPPPVDATIDPDHHGPWLPEETDEQVRDAKATAPATGSASISGVVLVAGDRPQPARRAQVTISSAVIGGSRAVLTDDTGRFQFTRLPQGRYALSAAKAAFLNDSYGASRVGRPGTPITLGDGQAIGDITLTLVRGAVIAGVVRMENGEPAADATVQVLRYNTVSGERRLQSYGGAGPNRRTDDRGAYRVYGIPPGEYVVAASQRSGGGSARVITAADVREARQLVARQPPSTTPPAESTGRPRMVAPAPMFYPGTPDLSSAVWIVVGPGEEKIGIDIPLRVVPTARVEGTVSSAVGPLPPNVEIRIVSFSTTTGVTTPLDINMLLPARPAPDGRFTFSGVPPGQYAVVATTRAVGRGRGAGAGPAEGGLWGTAEISVSGENLSGVALTLQPGMSVSGRVVLDAADAAPALTGVRISLVPELSGTEVAAGRLSTQTDATGAFNLPGLTPGRYSFRALMPAGTTGWQLRSVAIGGKDIPDQTIELRGGSDLSGLSLSMTNRLGEITGKLQDPTGRPAPDYYVILFPADSAQWRSRLRRIFQTRPATDGRFTLRDLLPGDYRLAALTDVEPGEWLDPEFLKTLVPASIALSLADGEKKVQDVRIAK
jgi:hypothetical protein